MERANDKEVLNERIVAEYQNKVKKIQESDKQNTGIRRVLAMELMERCGVTELEAINILNGYHVMDYIRKYEILNGIVKVTVDEKKKEAIQQYFDQLAELESRLAEYEESKEV